MNEDEIIPGQEGTDLELENDFEKDHDQGTDPLDLITDPDELRDEVKKFRAIAKRRASKEVKVEEKPKEEKPATETNFVTKADLARVATREAKELVGEDIVAVYDELLKIPLGGYDHLDAKSIAANLKERFAIFKARSPEEKKKEDLSELTTTKVAVGTGAGTDKKTEPAKKDPPNFSIPQKVDNWYKPKTE